jgi:hypothetical protein
MLYKAKIKQQSEGCDYTISCGETIIDVYADTIEEAKDRLFKIIKSEYLNYERRLGVVELYEISKTEIIDIKKLYEIIDADEEKAVESYQNELDYQQYLKLKNRFENEPTR